MKPWTTGEVIALILGAFCFGWTLGADWLSRKHEDVDEKKDP